MTFKGIIFDLNGVLWWDGHLQERSWKQFAAQVLDVFSLSDEQIAVHVHGRTNQHTFEILTGHPVEGEELARLTRQKETIYRQLCLEQGSDFRLSPGAIELLGFLAAHRVARTIATASGKVNVDFFVEHLNLDRWFDVERIVYDDGRRPGKPAPDIYLQAARNLGLAPAQCIVVEDSWAGIQAAHAAGIGHIIALGPAHMHHQLFQLRGVARVVGSLHQIPKEQLFL
ncbi:MAG: HAD family phosphatase [Anaerolineae bacterium]|nr:HAD family phosphatase [Anaerolineae bacterium]